MPELLYKRRKKRKKNILSKYATWPSRVHIIQLLPVFRLICVPLPIALMTEYRSAKNSWFCCPFWGKQKNHRFCSSVMTDPYFPFVNTQSNQRDKYQIKGLQILFKSSKLQMLDFSNRLKLYCIEGFKYIKSLN